MAIESMKNVILRPPIKGKVRLGRVTQAANGNDRPENTPYFLLHDAPELEKIYGDKPTELHVRFYVPHLEEVAAHHYKLYKGGYKDKKTGEATGGVLQCIGNGEIAEHIAKRDPITRMVPERACLLEKCPDWCDSRGRQQCKPNLRLKFMCPRLGRNNFDIYEMDTYSMNNISEIISLLTYRLRFDPENFTNTVFRLYKYKRKVSTFDASGKPINAEPYFIGVDTVDDFFSVYMPEIAAREQKMLNKPAFGQPEIAYVKTDDPYADEQAPDFVDAPVEVVVETKQARIEDVANHRELMPLFDQLTKIKGKKNDFNIRLLTAKKFEASADPFVALRDYLIASIGEQAPVKPEVKPEPEQTII